MGELVTKIDTRCDEISVFDNHKRIKEASKELAEYLNTHEDVYTISANQLGRTERMFAIKFEDGLKFFVNPMIVSRKGIHVTIESNPGLPDRKFLIARSDVIELNFQDIFGNPGAVELSETPGDLVQQQIDLLDGVTLEDFGLEVFDDFLNATKEEQDEVIQCYIESIEKRAVEIEEEIKADPEMSKVAEAIDFIVSVARGDTKVEMPAVSKRKQRKLDKLKKKIKSFGKNYTKKKKKPRK